MDIEFSRILEMKQAEFKALEAIFEREIDGTLPYQSNKNIYKELETAGFVQQGSEIIGRDIFGDSCRPLRILFRVLGTLVNKNRCMIWLCVM